MQPYKKTTEEALTPLRTNLHCVGCNTSTCVRSHYGAPSCHGCKAFFRRTVFGGRVYVCGASNTCNTSNEARNSCRACRMNNCLRGGMNPKLVREERLRGLVPSSPEEPNPSERENDKWCHSPPTTTDGTYGLVRFLCALEKEAEISSDTTEVTNPAARRYPFDWSCSRLMQPIDVYSQWSRAFILHTDWAMGVPEYRSLCLSDQTVLFKNNFPSFTWITYAYKCYVHRHRHKGLPLGNGAYVPYNSDDLSHLDPIWSKSYGILCKKIVDQVVVPMCDLNLTFEEYCLMKTLALFQIDSQLTDTGIQVCTVFKERIMEALSSQVANGFPYLSQINKSNRILKIALLLPAFTHIGYLESEMIRILSAPRLQ